MIDFDTAYQGALVTARTTLEALTEVGDDFQPMLHIDTGETSALVIIDDAPRNLADPWRSGRKVAEAFPHICHVFFISDSYQLTAPKDDPATERTVRRYAAGITLAQLYLEGAPGVVEALNVIGVTRDGRTRMTQQYYVRRGNRLEWTETVEPEEATKSGAVYELLSGILGNSTN